MDVSTILAETRDAMQAVFDGTKTDDGSHRAMDNTERIAFDELSQKADGLIDSVKAHEAAEAQKATDAAKMKSLSILPTIDKREPLGYPTAQEIDQHYKSLEVKADESERAGNLGAMFTGSKSYTAALAAGGGQSIDSNGAKSIEAITGGGVKTLLASPAVGTTAAVSGYAMHPHALLDAVTIGQTGKDSLVRHVATRTSNAAVVAEGVLKPEDALTFVSVTLTPQKIAAWIPVTDEALADHEGMETLINNELVDDVLTAIEARIAAVLAAATGVQAQAFDTNMLTSIRKGITLAEAVAAPTGVFIGTADAQTLDLLTSTGDYGPQPFGSQPTSVWGLPLIRAGSFPSGFAYVGRTSSLQWLERTPMQIKTGWTGTQFTENEVTILAEQRGVTHVAKPISWVKVDTVTP